MNPRNPFAALGLRPSPGLTDEDIRSAWRRIASQTHPDREDGGDPDAYRAASAAYMELRTGWGRSEALEDLRLGEPPRHQPPPRAATPAPARLPWLRAVLLVPSRIIHGRPTRLALRILAAVIAGLLIAQIGAPPPSTDALITGIATWLLVTSRGDLAPPPGR
jgi:curved DNA-binding protein CbpA